MHRMTYYELKKIWGNKSFILAMCVAIILNLFMLWYTNLGKEDNASLNSYKALSRDIASLSEDDKNEYITDLKETMDGVELVQQVISMRGNGNEQFVDQLINENPGAFEKYYDVYESGEYLKYTDSLWSESTFINEIYEEQQKVYGYNDYLISVQENKNKLNGISIFGQQDNDTFSSRNIEKSGRDYEKLDDTNMSYMPSKGITEAMDNNWTDIFLVLTVFLYVGAMIVEEKQKKLFYVTKCTKHGDSKSIIAKLLALLIHISVVTVLLYLCNLVHMGLNAGCINLGIRIQSYAPLMESNLSISTWQYILVSIVTKALGLFGIGSILTACCIVSKNITVPYIVNIVLWALGFSMYNYIPAASRFSMAKYLNLVGMMKTSKLYGAYGNFDLFGQPYSRLVLTVSCILIICVISILLCIVLYSKALNMEMSNSKHLHIKHKKCISSLFLHENKKLMISYRFGIIYIAFLAIIIMRGLSHNYHPSIYENYYQDIMMKLEGEIDDSKEKLVLSEGERFDEAFAKIDEIDEQVASGKISDSAGDELKSKWYAITAFYPSYLRVEHQYERIKESGGSFIYDTGYLYLFGTHNDDYIINLVIMSVGVIIVFGNVIAMEYDTMSWKLIGATKKGKKAVIVNKVMLSVMWVIIMVVVNFVARAIGIAKAFPMHRLFAAIKDIAYCEGLNINMPILLFVGVIALSQIVALLLILLIVILMSGWRKSYSQSVFFGAIILIVPLLLSLMGFGYMKWVSVYPLFSWCKYL